MDSEDRILSIPCDQIRPFQSQPREYFDPEKMMELRAGIKIFGQKRPGLVKRLPSGEIHKYEIVDGERRYRICTELGIPFRASIKEFKTEKEQFLEGLILNHGGAEHTDIENFQNIIRLKKDFDMTTAEVAAVFGNSDAWVSNYLRLRDLDPKVLDLMNPKLVDKERNRLKMSQALALLDVEKIYQYEVAKKAIIEGMKTKELKFMVQRHEGFIKKDKDVSPRAEYDKFRGFLQRSMVDLEIALRQPRGYFFRMFQYRAPEDLDRIQALVESTIDNLQKIKASLSRIKSANE